jgi:hypothetical protein
VRDVGLNDARTLPRRDDRRHDGLDHGRDDVCCRGRDDDERGMLISCSMYLFVTHSFNHKVYILTISIQVATCAQVVIRLYTAAASGHTVIRYLWSTRAAGA